jgi:hypothetical protein
MSYDKGPFAFFDGSSSEFRKALKPGDTIAGLTVQTIEPNRVTLGGATNHVELPIGKQLQKQDNGEWTVGDRTEYGTPPPVAAALTRPTYATNSASAAGTNPSSIVEGIQGALLELLSDGSEPPAPPAGSSAGSSTQPPAPSSGGASPDDILARLRARAAAERGDNP